MNQKIRAIILAGITLICVGALVLYKPIEVPSPKMHIEDGNFGLEADNVITFYFENATLTMTAINGTIYIDGSNIVICNLATSQEDTK